MLCYVLSVQYHKPKSIPPEHPSWRHVAFGSDGNISVRSWAGNLWCLPAHALPLEEYRSLPDLRSRKNSRYYVRTTIMCSFVVCSQFSRNGQLTSTHFFCTPAIFDMENETNTIQERATSVFSVVHTKWPDWILGDRLNILKHPSSRKSHSPSNNILSGTESKYGEICGENKRNRRTD